MTSQNCISDADLARLWDSDVTPQRGQVLQQHIEGCPECRARWQQMSEGARHMESLLDAAWQASGNCLSDYVLAGFVGGSLDPSARQAAEKHLFDCERCRDALAQRFAGIYEQQGDAWWSTYVAHQIFQLLTLVPERVEELLGVLKIAAGEPPESGQTVRLPMFDRAGKLAASTGDGLSEQRFSQDDPPFEFHLVQFGRQLRIEIRAEGEDSCYATCPGKLEFLEGQICRYFRVVLIEKGQGQCLLEPDEAIAIPLGDRPPEMRFTPLVTLADLETVGAEAYRPILARLLREAEPSVRRAAVEVAARIYGPNVDSLVGHMTEDDDQEVRQAAERALNQFPKP